MFLLTGLPLYNERYDAARCGVTPYTCPDPEAPIYAACRHPTHGLAATVEECHAENPTASQLESPRRYSTPGLTINNLRALASPRAVLEGAAGLAPRCTTANDLQMRNATEVRTKFDALMSQLAALEGWDSTPASAPANVNRPVLRQQVVDNAKLLFELKGGQFDDAPATTRTEQGLELYEAYPEQGSLKLTRVDPSVDFSWGELAPVPEVGADHFAVRWTGKVKPRFTETYTFYTQSDDGVRLWVNGELVIGNWTLHGLTENVGTIALTADESYDVRMEFFDYGSVATAKLLWSSASQAKEVIPSSRLATAGGSPGLKAEYFDHRRVESCGNPWMPPVPEATCPASADTNGLFALCRKLTLDHVPPTSAALVLGQCIEAITQAQANACTQGQYQEAYDSMILPMLKGHLVAPHAKLSQPAALNEALQRKLAYVDQWYRTARAQVYGGDRLATPLQQRASQVLGEFWRGAYMSEHPLGMRDDELELPVEAVTADALQSLSDDYLKVDRAVLSAAFSNRSSPATPPLTSAPLALVVGDALRGMSQRLGQVAAGHDLACRFRDCSAGRVSSEVSQLWRLMGTLPDASSFTTLLASSPKVSPEWRTTLGQLSSRHDVLRQSIEDGLGLSPGTYQAGTLDARAAETHPALLKELVERVRDARQRITSFDQTGVFSPALRNVLHTGMNSEKQAEIDARLSNALDDLTSAINAYEFGREGLVTTYLQEMRAESEQDRTMNLIRQRLLRMTQLDTDLAGMRHNARTADARQGEFVRTFETLASLPQVADFQVAVELPETVSVSGLDALYAKPAPQTPVITDNVRALAAKGWVRQAEAGDILRIEIGPQASWSPTCAFRAPQARLLQPGTGQLMPVNITGVTTGPEGFSVSESSGTYTAKSVASTSQSGTYETLAATQDVCAGVRAQVSSPFSAISGTGVTVYAEARMCASHSSSGQWSETESETSTDGQERRSSASFTAGLRLPNTPFPRLPAGSLLLVELERGGTSRGDIVQIHPLQRSLNTVLVNNAQSDFILVANDRQCGEASDLSLALTVHHTRPLLTGSKARDLLEAMAMTKTAMEAEGELALKQGHVNAATLASIRGGAITTLQTKCSCALSSYPEHLQSLFTSWVDHEIASLARHADIIAAERELALIAIELEGLGMDLTSKKEESRLLKLLPLWALRNMEGAELAERTEQLTDIVNSYLFPIIHLRYPEVISSLSSSATASGELAALIDGTDLLVSPSGGTTTSETLKPHWSRSRLATAKIIKSFVTRVKTALATARLGSDNSATTFPVLAISFPKPGVHAPGWTSNYNMADALRSAKVWDELLNGEKASLTVLPEDLYHVDGGEKMLCHRASMVIRSMTLYFSIPDIGNSAATMNNLPQSTGTWVDPSMTFVTKSGPEEYQQLNSKWLGPVFYPLFGEPHDAKFWFQGQNSDRRQFRSGNGLSPFTTFDINPKALRNWVYQPLVSADEVVLLFEVETEPTFDGGNMTWIKTCQPSASLAGGASASAAAVGSPL
ncbi:PA14 domain-containing protein [Pyxidicoccus trucidator]|uniref:PA14 domain-containing protein n=1 Tax=Pyxidicoccus trucidator TaxID=2709662 RepID=UPI0013DD7604|nr:PA14 domain-containing protein [Pyxidicoccus trucidator]